eukprot:13887668-Alexandrium_andersonii.AAC.1
MSASLVGSEMCIRDRPRPCTAPRQKFRPRPSPSRTRLLSQPRQMLEPVSYTHLTLPTICSV